jgi:D-glycero-D-manno-heptose 1,7-bisphosphate phosphatase
MIDNLTNNQEYKTKAVFFDRDGVVNMRAVKDYIKTEKEFHFLPDFVEFFGKLIKSDYKTFLITNQQGVGKGIMSVEQLEQVLKFMQNELSGFYGKGFDDIFYCTDLAETGSYFRKPNPGMILQAIDKWKIDKQTSWIIGDSPSDVIAGRRAGIRTVLIGNYKHIDIPEADYIIKSLIEIEKHVPIFNNQTT